MNEKRRPKKRGFGGASPDTEGSGSLQNVGASRVSPCRQSKDLVGEQGGRKVYWEWGSRTQPYRGSQSRERKGEGGLSWLQTAGRNGRDKVRLKEKQSSNWGGQRDKKKMVKWGRGEQLEWPPPLRSLHYSGTWEANAERNQSV